MAGVETSNKLVSLTESNAELTIEIDILTQTIDFKNTQVKTITEEHKMKTQLI
jgi:hypothetical protein